MNDQTKYLTVGALTRYLKMKFDTDDNLRQVYLKGEISNFKSHTTGHFYFSIKDETSKINAIMFQRNASKLPFLPTDGMKVLVTGRISVYEATGNYQIYVEDMMEDGIGNLYIAFEKLKEQLSKEGLFNPEHKKKIPKIPSRIGIITAKTGAAIRDILSTIERRFPYTETILFPSLVQGDTAKEDIVRNIKLAQNYDLDVLIVGRGGGSIEDLWAFNEEIVARAIYDSNVPIISAVGHEIDYTISDFVADLRAPTPTGAAELAVPNRKDVLLHLEQLKIRSQEAIFKKIKLMQEKLIHYHNSYIIKNPMLIYDNYRQKLLLEEDQLQKAMQYFLETKRNVLQLLKQHTCITHPEFLYKERKIQLYHIMEKLEILNPLSVLKRGYTITYQNNRVLKSVKELTKQDISIQLVDGIIDAKVIKIKEN